MSREQLAAFFNAESGNAQRAHFVTPPSFFFNDTATTEIYTLSLHDALPIFLTPSVLRPRLGTVPATPPRARPAHEKGRSEEHTSELQSRQYLVCRLLLE